MKKLLTIWIGLLCFSFTTRLSASLEIHCPSDKEITYSKYQAGNYYDKPSVYGPHTIYGPWIKPNLNCGSGYVDVKWEIVDHYARSYYCTQTIWVTGSNSGSPISVWCPKEMSVYCDQLDNLVYPKPEVNGYNYWIYGPWVSKSLNDCGVGSIWVEWKVVDGCGKNYYCKSAIWVKPRPGYAKIYWPKDFVADLCKDNIDPKYLPYPYGYPDIYQKNPCAKYGYSYQDLEFTFPNDTGICKKILRKWTVIDWCTYNLNGYSHNNEGKWEYSQVIKIISKAKPTISCTPEVKVNQEAYGPFAWVDIPIPTITSTCNGLSKLTHNSIYATKPSPDASGNYPIGTTLVIFKATDPCGNIAVCTTKVIVSDKTAPTPYCIGSLVVGIGKHSDGIYTILDPKKFDVGSTDNSTPKDKLKFSAVPSKFTCDSLGSRKVRIYVTDEAGNSDYCVVTLILQDNMGFCPKPPAPPVPAAGDTMYISGLLASSNFAPIDSVSVDVTSSQLATSMIANGKYKASKLKSGKDYKLTPYKRKKFLEGVTVDDYTLLIDHLQGKDTLTEPYQLLAADINLDDTVDMDDAFLLGYYILTYSNGLADSLVSWRFLPANYDISKINPLSNSLRNVPRFREYKNLDSNIVTADFVGIKIGDINRSGISDTSDIESIVQLNAKLSQLQTSLTKIGNSIPSIQRNVTIADTRTSKNLSKINLYPNPFQQSTTLQFLAPESEKARLDVYDINGRLVLTQSKQLAKGLNEIRIEGYHLSQHGIYLYHLRTDSFIYNGKFSYLD